MNISLFMMPSIFCVPQASCMPMSDDPLLIATQYLNSSGILIQMFGGSEVEHLVQGQG